MRKRSTKNVDSNSNERTNSLLREYSLYVTLLFEQTKTSDVIVMYFSEIEAKQEADLALRNMQIELRSAISRVKEVTTVLNSN